jgi:cyclase
MKHRLFLAATPEIFANAKVLRYNMTPAETALWFYLKSDLFNARF